jgi:hypothetical protein
MNQPLHIKLRSSVLDRERQLIIEPGFIEFDDTELKYSSPTKFYKEEIIEWRYGIKWIRGYQFYIGRIYCIDLKNTAGKIIKLRLKSIYGIRRRLLQNKYSLIWNAIQSNFFTNIAHRQLEKFQSKGNVEVLGVLFNNDGIILDRKSKLIPWLEVGTKNYTRYFAIYSITNPDQYKAFEYLNDWNTSILYSVSRSILKSKNL